MDDLKFDKSNLVLSGSITYLVFIVFTSWRLFWKTVRFIGTVTKKFFIDQFMYRYALIGGASHAPLVRNVEHPLDSHIPRRYDKIETYLGFVKLWISALSYVRRREGRSFNYEIMEFITGLERCYIDAASVYGTCLSTTRRPSRAPNPRLAFVYAVDPHLFCVPSLHVLVVCYTYKKLENLLRARGVLERFKSELAAVKARAIAITESILYVRQHSINCIPTALAMLSVIIPNFNEVEAKAFLSELFKNDHDITESSRNEIIVYMMKLYDRVVWNGLETRERYSAITDFLLSYEEISINADCADPVAG